MAVLKATFVAMTILFAILCHYFHNPIPAMVEDPLNYNVFATLARMSKHVALLGSILTSRDERLVLRDLVNYFEPLRDGTGDGVKATDASFDGVQVRIYESLDGTNSGGGLVYFHGGGFIISTPRGFDALCGEFVRRLSLVVVSVNYRKAPEYSSPSQLEDAGKAYMYFMNNSAKWGVNTDIIGVAGDSAGATIAASLVLKLRESGIKPPFQALMYPLLQAVNFNLPSYVQNGPQAFDYTKPWAVAGVAATYISGLDDYRTYIPSFMEMSHISYHAKRNSQVHVDWTHIPRDLIPQDYRPLQQKKHNMVISQKLESSILDPLNFPLMADSLENLPPTYILTPVSDTMRDDGILFAHRLRQDNVEVVHDLSKGSWHGMMSLVNDVKAAHEALENIITFISEQLSRKYEAGIIDARLKHDIELKRKSEVDISKSCTKEDTEVNRKSEAETSKTCTKDDVGPTCAKVFQHNV